MDFAAQEIDRSQTDRDQLKRLLVDDAMSLYDEREEELGEELMRALERYLCCRSSISAGVSTCTTWTTCARASTSAGSRRSSRWSAYKNEAFTLFEDLMNSIWSDFARMVYNVQVEVQARTATAAPVPDPAAPLQEFAPAAADDERHGRPRLPGGTIEDQPIAYGELASRRRRGGPPVVAQRRVDEHETIGRNDPCWCGSGKKFKKCHGASRANRRLRG